MHAVTDLLEGEIGLLSEELTEFLVALLGESRGTPAGMGAWPQGAGFLTEVEIAGDTVDGDAKQGGDDGQGADAAIHGIDNTLAQFNGVGLHGGLHRSRQGRLERLHGL